MPVIKIRRLTFEELLKYSSTREHSEMLTKNAVVDVRRASTEELMKCANITDFDIKPKIEAEPEIVTSTPKKRRHEQEEATTEITAEGDVPSKKTKLRRPHLLTANLHDFEEFFYFNSGNESVNEEDKKIFMDSFVGFSELDETHCECCRNSNRNSRRRIFNDDDEDADIFADMDSEIADDVENSMFFDPHAKSSFIDKNQSDMPCSQDSGYESISCSQQTIIDDSGHSQDISANEASAACSSSDPSKNASCPDDDQQPSTSAASSPQTQDSSTKEAEKKTDAAAIRETVQKWKSFIMPILREENKRDQFEIHKYGTEIMDSVGEVGATENFCKIVSGKPSNEVARYFASTLQLLNTGNVSISNVFAGQLIGDRMKISLLKRDRYHEHLTEFEAPSEEMYKRKKARGKR